MSKTTADTKFLSDKGDFSLVMSPSVKFGLFKNRRSLAPDASSKNPFASQRASISPSPVQASPPPATKV